MGKEGDLWDDSALIRAFDDAVSKFKVMHGVRNTEFNHEDAAERDAEESDNTKSSFKQEVPSEEHLLQANENHSTDANAPEPAITSSNMQYAQQEGIGYSQSDVAGDYNQLLSQYYELEEKRQKILQQLNQWSSSGYQLSGEGCSSVAQWLNCSQGHSVPANQPSHPLFSWSCCSYGCQPLTQQCSPCPTCPCSVREVREASFGNKPSPEAGPATAHVDTSSMSGNDMVKIAMGAATKALSSLHEGKDTQEKVDDGAAQSMSLPTDLAAVLNAWYSAGFHTGKYLVEQQSMAKKRH